MSAIEIDHRLGAYPARGLLQYVIITILATLASTALNIFKNNTLDTKPIF